MSNIYNLTCSLSSYLNDEYGLCRQTHALGMFYNGTKYQNSPLWETKTDRSHYADGKHVWFWLKLRYSFITQQT